MVVFVYIMDRYDVDSRIKWSIGLASIALLASDIVLFAVYLYNQNRNAEYLRMKLTLTKEQSQKEYYELLQEQNENQRILVHDIKGHLQSIEALNTQGEREKIDEYIKSLYEAANLKSDVRVSENELLNAVVLRYRKKCEDEKISFHVDIRKNSVDFLDDYELTSLFTNLLDNAMEAVRGVENPYIDLNVDRKEGTAFSVIHMINACADDPFEGERIRIPISRKKEPGHGYGLKSVEKVVKKHEGNMDLFYDKTKHAFHTTIILNNRI
jgi:sensor histidine kinase regulating citrate/malate metabolism